MPRQPNPPADPPVHIPGAGTLGMAMLIVSLSMLFLASMIAVIVIRAQSVAWPPHGMPRVPNSLWISTGVIVLASLTIQLAHNAVRRDDFKALNRNLLITLLIALLFLALQAMNWWEFYVKIRQTQFQGAYLTMFFVLTGLHALHVIGGLVPLVVVMVRARAGKYSRNFHPGVRYAAIYWHFLDVIWILLFGLLYF